MVKRKVEVEAMVLYWNSKSEEPKKDIDFYYQIVPSKGLKRPRGSIKGGAKGKGSIKITRGMTLKTIQKWLEMPKAAVVKSDDYNLLADGNTIENADIHLMT